MILTVDIPQETVDDLNLLADFHAVPVEDVIRHYITDGIGSEKLQQLGPWETADMQINGDVRRVK